MKWTEEKIKTFWMMKDSGSTLAEIARELGCTKNAVNMKAAELRNKAKKEKENAKMAECNESEIVEQKIEEPEVVKKVWYAAGSGCGGKYGTSAAAYVPSTAPVEEYEKNPSKTSEISVGEEKGLRAVGNLWAQYLGESVIDARDVVIMRMLESVAKLTSRCDLGRAAEDEVLSDIAEYARLAKETSR